MPVVECPFPGCDYKTAELDAVIVAALLNTHSMTHTPAVAASAKVEKVKRPTIKAAGTNEDWLYFEKRWDDYKKATQVKGSDLILQLLECCEETLRKDLTRATGGNLTGKPENEVLSAIRKLAVREENAMVARHKLHAMKQDREETIRNFGARVKGQANICCLSLK
ncbi:uncharacterized protein LOC132722387 [Ruditapes philippinarum]|uniref:uncharacterized protein LOC132722387 n=1 Tax=Ruditapes philippinarum TaxID=129788 RepID=UPI00295BBAED|nr:uncharacterized protein LOC132722387 [Ruditapes philippinarum]